jgi:hypothetical protein
MRGRSDWRIRRRPENNPTITSQLPLIYQPPGFCAYAGGECDQDFSAIPQARGLFLYASDPPVIAATIEAAAEKLKQGAESPGWRTWRDMDIGGRMVFCEICKSMRGSGTVFADVTTLNFNLLFEIGFAIGLGVSVRPIRDTTYSVDKKEFDALGMLDTLGYLDFTNAEQLVEVVEADPGTPGLGELAKKTYRESPLYVMKGPIDTDGAVRLLSLIKKSRLGFRTYDPAEAPRLPLHKARREIAGSFGVFAHLLSPNRDGARAHNGLCALVCGMAVAQQKPVLMLQEESVSQPIDYRDLVQTYESPQQIPDLIQEPLSQAVERLQMEPMTTGVRQATPLNDVDLGDTAAENEIGGLRRYFVQTGVLTKVMQGHAHLVVGRKGAGKSAMFYGLRERVKKGHGVLVLDMRPEGHQFTRLREAVLETLAHGQQEYTIAAFWTYLLSAEVAHKILNSPSELSFAERDPDRYEAYTALQKAFFAHGLQSGDDFSQRLLRQIDRMAERFRGEGEITSRTDLTELVYGGDIKTLNDAVASYLVREKDEVWLLLDNLDKSWATRGSTPEDMLILRGLLDASKALADQLDARGVTFRSVVFVRTDIYENLVSRTPDRGKDTAANLDWGDPEISREIIRRRIVASTEIEGEFEVVWHQIAPALVGIEDSFEYLSSRTLGRPRDLLMFLQAAIQVAIDRGHPKITTDDIRQAETGYSEDMLLNLSYEIEDTWPKFSEVVYAFHGAAENLTRAEVVSRIEEAGIAATDVSKAIELLLWYGFLGVYMSATRDSQYSFEVRYNLRRLEHAIEIGQGLYTIHPAFRAALSITD